MAYCVLYCTRPLGAKCPRASAVNAIHHWKHVVTTTYPVSSFHILLLPTIFLCASSTWNRTTTAPSHTWGHVDISEPLGTQHLWHSDSFSIRGMQSLFLQCINTPQSCHFVTGPYIYASRPAKPECILQNNGTFFTSYVRMQHLVVKPSIAS